VVYSRSSAFRSKRLGDVINLNKYRKQKARAEREKQAGVNRRLFGRTKAERAREELQKQQLTRSVDGARRVGPEPAAAGSAANADAECTTRRDAEEPGEPECS